MEHYLRLGNRLREFRKLLGRNISQVAHELDIDRSFLSKIENGHERPSRLLLNKLISLYSLTLEEVAEILSLAGYMDKPNIFTSRKQTSPKVEGKHFETVGNGKEVFKIMDDKPKDIQGPGAPINVEIDKNKPAVYCDSAFVTTNKYGLMIDFAQSVASTNNQIVTARVGMSKEHARALAQVLERELKKIEDSGKN